MAQVNEVRYIPPEKSISRVHEVLTQKTPSKQLDISSDQLVIKEKTEVPDMTATSALQVQEAMQRRGIALVFADLVSHEVYSRYLTSLFGHLHREPPPGYNRCTVSQLVAADKLVWQALLEENLRPKRDEAGNLALDEKLIDTLQSYRVSFALLPLGTKQPIEASEPEVSIPDASDCLIELGQASAEEREAHPSPKPKRHGVGGIPGLNQTERARVSTANRLYEFVAVLVNLANDTGLLVVVENPRSSLFWLTKFWKAVKAKMLYSAHQACAYGSDRPKWTVLAFNHRAFSAISQCCPGESPSHIHKPWGVVHSAEGTHFSTSEQTAYPRMLAFSIAKVFADILVAHGWGPPPEFFDPTLPANLTTMRAVAATQPKAGRIPPIVREHKKVILVRGPAKLLSHNLQPMQRLKTDWQLPPHVEASLPVIPAGAQFLRHKPLRSSGGLINEASDKLGMDAVEQAWGIPFTPDELIAEATIRGHPQSCQVGTRCSSEGRFTELRMQRLFRVACNKSALVCKVDSQSERAVSSRGPTEIKFAAL
eukprot:s777_g31.t1